MSSSIQLRAFIQIDRLQPQFAAYNGATVQGSIPLAGDTILVGELGPGNEVFHIVDVALKAASIEATTQIVEREFGFFFHVEFIAEFVLEHTVARQPIVDQRQNDWRFR